MITVVEKMSAEQVNQAINNEKQMVKKMLKAVSSNPQMKEKFQHNLDKLSQVHTKDEYIAYLKNKH